METNGRLNVGINEKNIDCSLDLLIDLKDFFPVLNPNLLMLKLGWTSKLMDYITLRHHLMNDFITLRNVYTTLRNDHTHCVTGAVLTHDVMYTEFYF